MMPSAQPRGLLKNFRRKSSGNALDSPQDNLQQSSFRVLERPDKTGGRDRSSTVLTDRPGTFPLQHHTKSADNLGSLLNSNRTTNSNSSGYYDTEGSSARHSSSSTLPSSLEADQDQDYGELFPIRKQKTLPAQLPIAAAAAPTAATDTIPLDPPAPSFVARAGRALSFGLKSKNTQVAPVAVPYTTTSPAASPSTMPPTRPPPARPVLEGLHAEGLNRDRTMTGSTYASTAKPPPFNSSLEAPDFGGDFENMFEDLSADRKAAPQLPNTVRKIQSAYFNRPDSPIEQVQQDDSDTLFPARTSSRLAASPASDAIQRPGSADGRRYSWGSKRSSEELISGDSSAFHSPSTELFPASSKPTGAAALTSLATMRGYAAVPSRQISPDPRDSPASPSDYLGAGPRSPTSVSPLSNQRKTPSRPQLGSRASPTAGSPYNDFVIGDDSADNTPRPRKSVLRTDAAFLYESPTGPENKFISPVKQRAGPTPGQTPKKMTSAQFEQAQRVGKTVVQRDADEKSEASDNEELEDEDEVEKQKKIAAQRRRQEATMSVYRQQMKKVAGGTGDTLSGLPSPGAGRPGMERPSLSNLSIPGFSFNGGVSPGTDAPVEEEDEDIPLAILQAHGFPSKTRPPNHLSSPQSTYAPSAAGDAPGALPAFARKLPQDPYFGAGLVNPSNRQSLAYGGSGASVYGVPASGPPGGLVGVIASEEKARAGRRGSPNPVTGGYNAPLPSNLQGQPPMPGFPRSMSMTSLANPPMGMGMGMDQFGQMSPEQAAFNTQQQMAHLMQMQTQMMQQMMALQAQAGQMGFQLPSIQSPSMQNLQTSPSGFLPGPNPGAQRPMSIMSGGRPPSVMGQGRSMSMLQPPSNWGTDMQQQRQSMMGGQGGGQYAGSVYGMNAAGPSPGYTPSIAPSERSNIGMPSRYRPVSFLDTSNQNAGDRRSKTMTSTSYNPQTMAPPIMPARTPSPLGELKAADDTAAGVPAKPKSTIRIIDKIRGAPRSSFFRSSDKASGGGADEEEDEAGWAQLAKKREALRQKRASKAQKGGEGQEALADLYQELEDD